METITLARSLAEALEEKKAENILVLDLRALTPFTDYFVIGTGASDRQLNALVDAVGETAKKKHRRKAPKTEGRATSGWVLLDFGGVIVHLFSPEMRRYYQLEELWQEGKVVLRIQ